MNEGCMSAACEHASTPYANAHTTQGREHQKLNLRARSLSPHLVELRRDHLLAQPVHIGSSTHVGGRRLAQAAQLRQLPRSLIQTRERLPEEKGVRGRQWAAACEAGA